MKSSGSNNNSSSNNSGSGSGSGSTSGSGSGKSRASRSKTRRSPYPQSTAAATASSTSTETVTAGSSEFGTEYTSALEKSSSLELTGHTSELGVSGVLPPPALQPVPYPNMMYTHPGSADAAVGMGMGVGVDRYSALYSTPYNHPGMTMYRDAACVYSPYQAAAHAHAHHHQRYLDNRSPYRYYEERYYPARDPAAYPGYLSSAAAIQSAAVTASHAPRLSHLSLDAGSVTASRDQQPCHTETSSDGLHHQYDFRTGVGVEDGGGGPGGTSNSTNDAVSTNDAGGSSAISQHNTNDISSSGATGGAEMEAGFRSSGQNASTVSTIQSQGSCLVPTSRSSSREAMPYGGSNNTTESASSFGMSHQHQHQHHNHQQPGPYSNRSESSASDVDVGNDEHLEKQHRGKRHGSYSQQHNSSTSNANKSNHHQQQNSQHNHQLQHQQQQQQQANTHLNMGESNSNPASTDNIGLACGTGDGLQETARNSSSMNNISNRNKHTTSDTHQKGLKEDSYYGQSDSSNFQSVSPPHREACIPQSVIIRRLPANTSSSSTYPTGVETPSSPSNFNASPCSQQKKSKQSSSPLSSLTYSSSLSSSTSSSNHLTLIQHQNTQSHNEVNASSSPSSSSLMSQPFSTSMQQCQEEPSRSTIHHASNNNTHQLQHEHQMLHYPHHQYSNYQYLQNNSHNDHLQQHHLQQQQQLGHHQQQQDQRKTPLSTSMSHSLEVSTFNGRSPGSTGSAEDKLYELSNGRSKHHYGSSPASSSSSKTTPAASAVTAEKTMSYDMSQPLSSSPTPANSYYDVAQAGTPDQAKLFTDLSAHNPKLYDMSSVSTVNKLYEMSSGMHHSTTATTKSFYDVSAANTKLYDMAAANTASGKFYDVPGSTASKFYDMHTPASHGGYHQDKMGAVQGSALAANDYSSCLKAAAYGYDNYSQAAGMYQQAAAALQSQRSYHHHHGGMPQAGYTSVIVDPQQYHVANGYAVH